MIYLAGQLVAMGHVRSGRKIAQVIGYTSTGKICVRVWRHNSRCWTNEQRFDRDKVVGFAPDDWPQTKAARLEIYAERSAARRRP